MPYKVRGKCVYKKSTNKKVGCTKGNVKKYLTALHINAKESVMSFKKFYEQRTREELKAELADINRLLDPPLCPRGIKQYGSAEEYQKMLLHKKKKLQKQLDL